MLAARQVHVILYVHHAPHDVRTHSEAHDETFVATSTIYDKLVRSNWLARIVTKLVEFTMIIRDWSNLTWPAGWTDGRTDRRMSGQTDSRTDEGRTKGTNEGEIDRLKAREGDHSRPRGLLLTVLGELDAVQDMVVAAHHVASHRHTEEVRQGAVGKTPPVRDSPLRVPPEPGLQEGAEPIGEPTIVTQEGRLLDLRLR